jgi:DNA topoisomerase-6 subunit B
MAPMAIFVHLASVWVPFTSEAKEAVAHYPELLREITLALQECGRRLAQSLRARARAESEQKRKSIFERYIPELGQSLGKITGQNREDIEKSFFKALPNFVNVTELAEDDGSKGGAGGANGAPAPAPVAAEAEESGNVNGAPAPKNKKEKSPKAPAPPTKKPPKGKKGEQLSLLE